MGSIRLGTSSNDIKEIKKVYIGSTEIKAVYIGSTKIWEAPSADPWVTLINTVKSRNPVASQSEIIHIAEYCCEGVGNQDWDGKALLYYKDDNTGMLSMIDAAEYPFPTNTNGWTFLETFNIADGDDPSSGMPMNSNYVYLFVANDYETLDLYWRSASV